mmetsp:Transcript_13067/g.14958  ORF Transcript_13067/g.14958 Transcript_13067/m.14958 type:complete len:331 (+) Transcript_13067:45-1037(+)
MGKKKTKPESSISDESLFNRTINGSPKDVATDEESLSTTSSHSKPPALTQIRDAISPYLPPPVVQGIRYTDEQLLERGGKQYLGGEPSMTILATILLAFLLFQLVRNMTYGGKAIVDDDEAALAKELKQAAFHHTILFVGNSQAGKTRLFYHYCYNQTKNIQTVISLRPNIGFVNNIRFMDYPGHWEMSQLPISTTDMLKNTRIVLVLDATKPVAPTATILNQFLQHFSRASSIPPPVFVACHQSDRKGAKNPKRLRLQLRTELERIFQLDDNDNHPRVTGYQSGQPLVLEKLLPQLAFVATSSESQTGLDDLDRFIKQGTLPEKKLTRR